MFVQSVVWGINAFDQWGVELGKKLCESIVPLVQRPESASGVSSSLRGALDFIAKRARLISQGRRLQAGSWRAARAVTLKLSMSFSGRAISIAPSSPPSSTRAASASLPCGASVRAPRPAAMTRSSQLPGGP